jgi:hypothetical protein
VTIAQGGVLPNIHSVLIPKSSAKETPVAAAPKKVVAKKEVTKKTASKSHTASQDY